MLPVQLKAALCLAGTCELSYPKANGADPKCYWAFAVRLAEITARSVSEAKDRRDSVRSASPKIAGPVDALLLTNRFQKRLLPTGLDRLIQIVGAPKLWFQLLILQLFVASRFVLPRPTNPPTR
jgi:hypothetical protein